MACLTDGDLLQLLEGSLSPERRQDLLFHLGDCGSCRSLVAHLGEPVVGSAVESDAESRPIKGLPPDVSRKLGRYWLQDLLGVGGMGAVFRAYDPSLRRPIAIKVVRQDRLLEATTQRLLTEAQTLARLTSPYVVQVFDVGLADGEFFIAMEQINGPSLQVWSTLRPRSTQEILKVFVEAGQGLLAAHRAGIIHRDFKPQNVLVRPDGHAVVTDFGLAQDAGAEKPAEVHQLAGTLPFLAPELKQGFAATEKSDQYAFCLALRATLKEQPPGFLTSVLQRGLSSDPDKRFGSMSDLLAAIQKAQARRRRLWMTGSLAAGLSGLVLALMVWLQQLSTPCDGGARLAAQTFGPNQQARLRTHLGVLASSLDSASADKITAALDQYAKHWAQQHRQVCLAYHDETLPAHIWPLAQACLERARLGWEALISQLSTQGAAVAQEGLLALSLLSDPADCTNVSLLRDNPVPYPLDPAARESQVEQERAVAAFLAVCDTGQMIPCKHQAPKLLMQAGDRKNLSGLISLRLGALLGRIGSPDASDWLARAERDFESAGNDRERLNALLLLADIAIKRNQFELGHERLERSRAIVFRLGQNPFEQAKLLARESLAASLEGDPEKGLALADRGLSLCPIDGLQARMLKPKLLDKKALALGLLGRLEEKLAANREVLRDTEALHGNDHPEVEGALNTLGIALNLLGCYPEAKSNLERARSITERVFPNPSLQAAGVLRNLAQTYEGLGQTGRALETIEAAKAQQAAIDGTNSLRYASFLCTEGALRQSARQDDQARRCFEQALEIFEPLQKNDSSDLVCALNGMGFYFLGKNQLKIALGWFERSLQTQERFKTQTWERADAAVGWVRTRKLLGLSSYDRDQDYLAHARTLYQKYQGFGLARLERMRRYGMIQP